MVHVTSSSVSYYVYRSDELKRLVNQIAGGGKAGSLPMLTPLLSLAPPLSGDITMLTLLLSLFLFIDRQETTVLWC